ncbi:MAG: OsmC family protein [Anaerolineae bacterium]|nr:OsmC family protein [Anaerolineae bacterium]MBL8105923.1 OsmC family protein [Anaerolineales bacterium]MCC7188574.1 OsmC family protein [Anaerolineales bacterium]
MEILIDFPGGARVDAHVRGHLVHTDQPRSGGGDDSAPSPFELFLASLGTCAGIYILGFCRQRNLPTEGVRIVQRVHADTIELEIQVPPAFPKQYLGALIRSAELCKVKKTLENPPQFKITARTLEGE